MVQPMKIQKGGSGGVVVCLGVGGLVDMSSELGLDSGDRGEDLSGGIEVWLIDARRPWNLGNVFEGDPAAVALREISGDAAATNPHVDNGRILPSYKPGRGGIIVYDDGDIDEELGAEREAYCELTRMQGVEDYGEDSGESGDESEVIDSIEGEQPSKKRKSWSDRDEEDEESEDGYRRHRQRQRSNSVCLIFRCIISRILLIQRPEWLHFWFIQSTPPRELETCTTPLGNIAFTSVPSVVTSATESTIDTNAASKAPP